MHGRGRPVHGDGRLLDQCRGEFGHAVVVAVRLIRLQHGKLRRMGGVNPFVAEVAVDLEDPLDSADHDALEVQLRRDAQVQVHVQGIHMRDEWPRRRPAVQHLKHRRFHLEIVAIVQCRAQRAIDHAPHLYGPTRLRSDDQIDIALPNPALFGEWFVGDRQWSQRLGRDRPRIGKHRELTAARRDHLAVHEQVVAQIHVRLECGQRFRTDLASDTITCNSVPVSPAPPSRSMAKHNLPELRRKMTRPAMPTISPVSLSGGRSGNASLTAAKVVVRCDANRIRFDALHRAGAAASPGELEAVRAGRHPRPGQDSSVSSRVSSLLGAAGAERRRCGSIGARCAGPTCRPGDNEHVAIPAGQREQARGIPGGAARWQPLSTPPPPNTPGADPNTRPRPRRGAAGRRRRGTRPGRRHRQTDRTTAGPGAAGDRRGTLPGMLAELSRRFPGAAAVLGVAEHIPCERPSSTRSLSGRRFTGSTPIGRWRRSPGCCGRPAHSP